MPYIDPASRSARPLLGRWRRGTDERPAPGCGEPREVESLATIIGLELAAAEDALSVVATIAGSGEGGLCPTRTTGTGPVRVSWQLQSSWPTG